MYLSNQVNISNLLLWSHQPPFFWLFMIYTKGGGKRKFGYWVEKYTSLKEYILVYTVRFTIKRLRFDIVIYKVSAF